MIKYENDNRQINDWFYAKYERKKGSAAKGPSHSVAVRYTVSV